MLLSLELTLHSIRSIKRTRYMRRERYRAQFRRNVKKTASNPKGKRTNDSGMPSVRARQRQWAPLLRKAKIGWSEDEVQEQARLLAAYHKAGSMRVPKWVKRDVYSYVKQYVSLTIHVCTCPDPCLGRVSERMLSWKVIWTRRMATRSLRVITTPEAILMG